MQAPFGFFPMGSFARLAWWLATTKHLSRRSRKWFRKRLARRFSGPFDVVAEGVIIRAWPAENRCDRIAAGQGCLPETAERKLIEPFLKADMFFVDVGANVGIYSLFVSARTNGTAHVLALEPHPRTFAKLTCNCALNGWHNIQSVNLAAGPEDGEAVLFSDGGGNIGGASLVAEASGTATSQKITTKSLPDILTMNGFKQIDLLKADVEGFEDRALLPLFADAANMSMWPSAILVETVHQALWRGDLLGTLRDCGYAVAGQTSENLLLTR